jgi:hypothetical protein
MPDEPGDKIPSIKVPAEHTRLPLSGVGMAAFIIAILSLAAVAIAVFGMVCGSTSRTIGSAGGFGIMVAFFLGINSIIRICRRTASTWSLFVAIPPVLLPGILAVCAFAFAVSLLNSAHCGHDLKDLFNYLVVYANGNKEQFPDPNKWCDLLVAKADIDPKQFHCLGDKTGPCSYALNPAANAVSPQDMVLLFEARPGWNQHGGPELLDPSHHRPRGCYILFCDSHVDFVKEKDLPSLRWTKEQTPPAK